MPPLHDHDRRDVDVGGAAIDVGGDGIDSAMASSCRSCRGVEEEEAGESMTKTMAPSRTPLPTPTSGTQKNSNGAVDIDDAMASRRPCLRDGDDRDRRGEDEACCEATMTTTIAPSSHAPLLPSGTEKFSPSSRKRVRPIDGRPRRPRRIKARAMLAATTALLLGGTLAAGGDDVPEGLLFRSDILGSGDPLFRGADKSPPSGPKRRGRVHPIHRIYREGAAVRRRAEELENSLPYFRTGIRGDPNHRLEYVGHPYDRMRRERERREQLDRLREQREWKLENDELTEEDEEGWRRLQRDLQREDEEEEGDPFQPIRIHFDTEALDGELTNDNGEQIEFVKRTILPRMQEYWSSALQVVPVEGNLKISAAELQGRLYCGDTEFSRVPATHMSTGIPDADIVLYVSGAPSARFCGPSTLAVAVACNFDQFDRPTAGAINFCLEQIDLDRDGQASESIVEDNVDVAIHEAAHVLGMSSNSYRFFWDPDSGRERTSRPFSAKSVVCVDGVERTLILPDDSTMKFFIATSGQRYASIVTPKVATVARNQFDCQELNGAQLENQPTGENSCTGDHWDERMYYPEALSGVISPTTNVHSPLTLALLEDSGWYKANYTRAHVSPWGHGVGCDFVSSPCLVGGGNGRDGAVPSYSRGYFCNKASSRGCSPSYTHKMACTVIDYSLRGQYEPPVQFQYFEDGSVGGPREADYCPVYGSVYSGMKPEQLDCRIPDNEDRVDIIYSEEYGEDSMCFETTSGEGRCYEARCIYKDFNLRLKVDGRWYTCEEDFQDIEVSTLSGAFGTTVRCPRLSSVCPDMFCPANCAGRGTCVFDAEDDDTGEERPRCECFDPEDESAGCSETFVLDGKYLRDGASLTDTIKTNFFEPLIAVFVDHPDTWTTASWAWAAALFVVFLLMILCICSSFWPEKEKPRKRTRRRQRYAV